MVPVSQLLNITLILAMAVGPPHVPAFAQDAPVVDSVNGSGSPKLEAGAEVDLNSVYVFRGMVYSSGPVAQSRAWASRNGLSVYAWNNVAMPAAAGARSLDEVDLGTSYSFERGAFTIAPAFDLYLYRLSASELSAGSPSGTGEASATLSYAAGDTEFSLQHVVDVVSYRGAYFAALGVSHDLTLARDTDVGAAVSLGWASARYHQAYLESPRRGLGLLSAQLSATRRLGRGLYVKGHVELTTVPDAGLRARVDRPTVVAAGLTVGVSR